ncbi:hypothetical protein [Massilia sp. Root351]|uniref:hypothetical protein n=1 Tax=Massilia sp. Root351 TaxID=1736522 RepID=UPI0012F66DCE|nr:hypothetical protein [Massilia sp. Root351]
MKLALEYAEYTRGLERSDQAALQFAQNAQRHFDRASSAGKEYFAGLARTAVGAVAAYASVSTVLEQFNRSIDSLASLDDLTQKTGASVENLSRLQQVAVAFDTDFGKVDGALTILARGMAGVDEESSKTRKALGVLGVSAKDAAGNLRDPAEVLVEVAKSLQGYEDGAGKAALITDVFKKSGAELLPYLNDVADSVDKFTGVSADAASAAATYQDQLGMLKANYQAMATTITIAALPALNDLLGAFSDTGKMEADLAKGPAGGWADDLAVGIARVIDVAKLLPGIFSAIKGSFKAVYADIEFAATAAHNLSPTVFATKLAQGRNPVDDLRKALAERNAVLDDANRRYEELWNKPANLMEQAVLARIAARANKPTPAAGAEKKTLSYSTGTDKDAKEAKSDYDALNKALQEKIALSARELELARPLTEAERQIATLIRGRAEGTVNLSDKEQQLLETGLMQLSLNQRLLVSRGETERQEKEELEANQKRVAGAFESVNALQAEIDNYGKLPEQITRAAIAKLELRKASLEANEGSQAEIATVEALIIANTRLAELQGKKTALEKGSGVAEAKELLDVMSSLDEVTRSAAAGMAKSFGEVGSAIGGITTALSGYGKAQAAVAAQLAVSLKEAGPDQAKIHKANAAAAAQSAQAQVRSYGDIAGAGKAFFKEHTAGYRAMDAVEKTFRAVEMAMAIESMVAKSGLLTAFTSLFVASRATETAVDTTATTASVANSGVRAAADGVAAVARTLASLPFPANVAAGAAVIALLAGLGVAISGGGSGGANVSKERQEAAGTGSILGDPTGKSDSIARSLDALEKSSNIELSHTAGMLASLRNIESSISGLGNLLVRTAGLTGEMAPDSKGSAYELGNSTLMTAVLGGGVGLVLDKLTGGLVGKITGKILGGVFGGKVTTLDTGVTLAKSTLGNALSSGVVASQYTDTKKDGGLFRSDKFSTSLSGLGTEANDQFTKVIRNLATSVSEAGNLLGVGGYEFTQHLNSFVVDVGKISLKGLSGEEIQKQLETVFSKVGDDLAKFGVAGLDQFQQVGEGYLETLVRVSSNYANLDSILASSGSTFGQTGLASIAARERLIGLTGGINELASKTSSFNDNFLTEAQRLAPVQKYVTEQLAAMGLAGITTRDQFRDVVLGLASSGALATEAGAKQYAALMDLSDAFAKTHAAIVDLSRSQEDIAEERRLLQERYDQATLTSVQLLERERDAKDKSNLALYEQTIAAEKARAAADALAETNAAIKADIDELVKAALPLAEQRALEVKGMAASTLALYEQREVLQAQAKAAAEAKAAADAKAVADKAAAEALARTNESYQQQIDAILKSRMSESELRKFETAGMSASTKALYDRLKALQGEQKMVETLKTAANSAMAVVSKSIEAEKASAKASLDAQLAILTARKTSAEELAKLEADSMAASIDAEKGKNDRLRQLGQSLKSTLDGMRLEDSAGMDRRVGQSQIAAALAVAKASGVLPSADALKDALGVVSQPSAGLFESFEDYARDFYVTAGQIADLNDLTDNALTKSDSAIELAEKQLDQLQKGQAAASAAFDREIKLAQDAYDAQILQLDQTLAAAQAQLDATLGNTVATVSVVDSLADFKVRMAALIEGLKTPAGQAATGGTATVAGRGVDADSTRVEFVQPTRASAGETSTAGLAGADVAQLARELALVRTELEAIRIASKATAVSTDKLATQFDQVTEGAVAMRTVEEGA